MIKCITHEVIPADSSTAEVTRILEMSQSHVVQQAMIHCAVAASMMDTSGIGGWFVPYFQSVSFTQRCKNGMKLVWARVGVDKSMSYQTFEFQVTAVPFFGEHMELTSYA